MKTGHYSVTTRPEKVTMRANRSDAVSPNLSPPTVTMFTSVLQFSGGGSIDLVVWSLKHTAAGNVCCLINRQSFLAQQRPVATDGDQRHTVTANRYAGTWHPGMLCGYGSITDVLWALQCAPRSGKKQNPPAVVALRYICIRSCRLSRDSDFLASKASVLNMGHTHYNSQWARGLRPIGKASKATLWPVTTT